ncbi:calcium channel flower isoform X2 [Plodia interpunctella]|uniref:calcium channel flower isoform X2 n=1 Tax=Plodia interpunctella TaxID=58824 RepID=UPI002367BE20|nr:calcium channel flower isoform X2 [Plodia interpunctella]
MSFTDKISMMMSRPGGENVQKDDVPWWMRYGGRGLGTVGSFFAILFGLLNCTGILYLNVQCLIAGIWQMLAGFLVIVCEAPCCCFFIDYVQTLSDKVDSRPYWNKAVLYCGLAVPPFLMCISVSTFLGSGVIFATGVIYGMMALGRKGSRDDMAAMAAGGTTPPGAPMASQDHNVTLMEDPDVWRPN